MGSRPVTRVGGSWRWPVHVKYFTPRARACVCAVYTLGHEWMIVVRLSSECVSELAVKINSIAPSSLSYRVDLFRRQDLSRPPPPTSPARRPRPPTRDPSSPAASRRTRYASGVGHGTGKTFFGVWTKHGFADRSNLGCVYDAENDCVFATGRLFEKISIILTNP